MLHALDEICCIQHNPDYLLMLFQADTSTYKNQLPVVLYPLVSLVDES